MIWLLALTFGISVTAGLYLALSRDMLRCLIGLAIVAGAVNLALLAAGRPGSTVPAVVPAGQTLLGASANPVPQALVLTAIVIGFALLCFSLVLMLRLVQRTGSDDVLALRHAEPLALDATYPPQPDPAHQPALGRGSADEPARLP